MRAVLKAPERFHQAARQPYIIGIEQGQKLGGRVANRDIPCGRYPTVRLLYVAQLRAQSLNERGDDLSSIISTAIVYEQDSPISKVCATTLSSAAGKNLAALYAGMMTSTFGISAITPMRI